MDASNTSATCSFPDVRYLAKDQAATEDRDGRRILETSHDRPARFGSHNMHLSVSLQNSNSCLELISTRNIKQRVAPASRSTSASISAKQGSTPSRVSTSQKLVDLLQNSFNSCCKIYFAPRLIRFLHGQLGH